MKKLLAIIVIALGGLTTVGCSISGPGIGGHMCSTSPEDAALAMTERGREMLEEDPVTGRSQMDVLDDLRENGLNSDVPGNNGNGIRIEGFSSDEEEHGAGC